MIPTITDLRSVFTCDGVLSSLKKTQDSGSFLKVDLPTPTPSGNNELAVDLMWEVSFGDTLFDEKNTFGYRIDHITVRFVATQTTSTSEIVIEDIKYIKVETHKSPTDGDLYLLLDLDAIDFKPALLSVFGDQPNPCGISLKFQENESTTKALL